MKNGWTGETEQLRRFVDSLRAVCGLRPLYETAVFRSPIGLDEPDYFRSNQKLRILFETHDRYK